MGKRSRKKIVKDGARQLDVYVSELAKITSKNFLLEKNVFETFKNVYQHVARIIELEREIGAGVLSDGPRSKHFLELIDWARGNGANVENIKISEFPDVGYGLECLSNLREGDLVCSIPRKVMMTVDSAHSPEMADFVKIDPMLACMGNVSLAIFLLKELSEGADSFWAPYLNSLPWKYNTVLHFTPGEIELMKGSPTQESAILQNIHIARQYAYFYGVFQKSENPICRRLSKIFSFELYRWAADTVFTRQNQIPEEDNEDGKVPALIPVWDMANHVYGPISSGYNSETSCCDCFSLAPRQKGEQVLICYGYRPNSEFFLHNGFVPDVNPVDKFRLHLGLAKSDPVQSLRADLLTKLGLPSGGNFYLHAGSDPVPGDLLAFIRIFSMDKGNLEHWLECGRWEDLKCMDCALDTHIESKTWKFLSTRISLLLSVYPPTPENAATAAGKLIVKLVEGEKKLLESALEYARLKVEH